MKRLFLMLLIAAAAATAAPDCRVDWTHGPVKIRPHGREDYSTSTPLVCARNEYCSFQVVVTARGRDCASVRADVSTFRKDAAEIPLSNITLYRQGFLNVFYRSSEQGDIGEWPDPLIPDVDPEYLEKRNAFPVDVSRISPAYKRYRAEKGRADPAITGHGQAFSSGSYRSARFQRFVVRITRGGRVGQARYQWWSEPGPVQPSAEVVTSLDAKPLRDGVHLRFEGRGEAGDFQPGDEFWIHAGGQRRQPLWVDVLIPQDAPAGVYSGAVRVSVEGQPLPELRVAFEVLPFAVPSTPTLANFFGIYQRGTYEKHFGWTRTEPQFRELALAYGKAALRNGITLDAAEDYEPKLTFGEKGDVIAADYSAYDAAVAPFMDGTATQRGARWTSLLVPRFRKLEGSRLTAAVRHFAGHAKSRGWYDRIFDLTFDEPGRPEHFDQLRRRAESVRAADPAIPRTVTTHFRPELVGWITRWVPIVNGLFPRARSVRNAWRERNSPGFRVYQERAARGESVWLYQTCMSHGCGETGRSPAFDDLPSYMVDASGALNRSMGILSALTPGVSGMLYWDVSYAHHPGSDPARELAPWDTSYYFGGNGDGSLFYTGTPDRIAGARHVAVESLRLKMIRDSIVDAELVLKLRHADEGEFLEGLQPLLRSMPREHNPEAWRTMRLQLARAAAKSAGN